MNDAARDDAATPERLDLQQAADALGVHYQTIYRWVRSGRLPATLVAGKYVVARKDLERVDAERSVPTSPEPPSRRRVQRRAEPMHAALVSGDEAAARRIAQELVGEGTPVADLIQEVIVPPLRRIGQDWHDGRLTIWVEHRASAMVERILAGIVGTRRGRRRGTAMVAAVSGDRHSLPTSMATAVLRDANWRVHHLGADMPPAELIQFSREHDVDVAVLSATNPAVADVVEQAAVDLEASGVPTVVGRSGATLDEMLEQVEDRRR